VVEKLAWVVLSKWGAGYPRIGLSMRVERKTQPMVWLVWIGGVGWEGEPLPVGGLSLGGGVRLLTKGGSFFEDPFFVERTDGGGAGFRGGIFGGKVVGGWVCKEANVRHLGKERKKKKVSKGGA
jgi:hypothetical protein